LAQQELRRSDALKTIQLFHGSEVAFWPNAATHFAGVVQAIPDLPEPRSSLRARPTASAASFTSAGSRPKLGIGDYEAIFIPWFWSPSTARPVPDGFSWTMRNRNTPKPTAWTLEQMAWRRNKMAELKDPLLFSRSTRRLRPKRSR
jgi:hypothetical protein